MYLGDIYTISVNLAGLPGMSVPIGKDRKGLPVGMQLIGNSFQEKTLIRAAYTYECATEKQFEVSADVRAGAGMAAGRAGDCGRACRQTGDPGDSAFQEKSEMPDVQAKSGREA